MALKTRIFQTAAAVTAFVNDAANSVSTVVTITFDSSSSVYVLFYQ